MASLQNNNLTKFQFDEMASYQNTKLAWWQVNELPS
jgi:hypothetical protein